MTVHKLKLFPEYFDAVANGIKTFEIRKNDRDYKVGDTLHLYEFDPEKEEFSGLPETRTCDVAVTYILTHEDFPDGIPEDYCVMGIRLRESGYTWTKSIRMAAAEEVEE